MSRMACRSISRSATGFTLLEVMLALAIFASLSLGAYQVLQGVLANDAITRDKGERLASLQRTFNQMERDFGQAVARPTRVEGEPNLTVFQAEPFQMQSDDWAVAWVRAGWLRITSYNVCYTKLLRKSVEAGKQGATKAAAPSAGDKLLSIEADSYNFV